MENERAEAEFVAGKMSSLIEEGYSLKDIVMLYRTNAQSRILEQAMLEHGFPYKIVGGVRFYQRKEIKDIIAYLRYISNPKDLLSLKRIINIPARGIGPRTFLSFMQSDKSGLPAQTGLGPKAALDLKSFEELIQDLRLKISKLPAANFIKYLLKSISYKEHLEDDTLKAEERWENIEELVSLSSSLNNLPPPRGIEALLEEAALMSEADEIEPETNRVHLMTLHASKGLEFPIVFMVGLEEGIFPHARSLQSEQELEEERRLCFVGLTRAKDKIFMTFALERRHFGSIQANPPSRFISEIPEALVEVEEEGIGEIQY